MPIETLTDSLDHLQKLLDSARERASIVARTGAVPDDQWARETASILLLLGGNASNLAEVLAAG